jgi:hypothetical protein
MIELLIFVIAFAIGWWMRTATMLNKILRDPDNMIDLLTKFKKLKDEEESESDPITGDQTLLNIERVSGVYYAYGTNGEFLAQGPDFRTMFQTIKDRFPNRDFRIDKYQPNLTEDETVKLVKSVFEVFKSNKSN